MTPLWKPQIFLKQLYSFVIGLRFSTLKKRPFDSLVLIYLLLATLLIFLQLVNYSILSSQFGFFDLLRAQYPLLMAFSILSIFGPKPNIPASKFVQYIWFFCFFSIVLNVVIATFNLEETIASSYGVFEFSFNQNLVVYGIFFTAVSIFYQTNKQKRTKQIFLLLFLLTIINVPNFQRARFFIIILVIIFFFLKSASFRTKIITFAVGLIFIFLLFRTEKFSNIVEAYFAREEAIDPSLAGRFIQIAQILSMDFNSLFGFGFLNTKTKDFFFDDVYFHPNDTGLFGVFFNGGIIGIAVVILLVLISFREIALFKKSKEIHAEEDPSRLIIKQSACLMIWFIIISSVFTASFFYDPMFLISYIFLVKRF